MGNDSLHDGVTRRFRLLAAAFTALVLGLALFTSLQRKPSLEERLGSSDRVAPYVPTPLPVVMTMLELAQITGHDVVYDLGSGDGRIVIMAAQKFGAQAVGVELDEKLYKESSARIEALGLEKRATILHRNMFVTDIRPATVVTLFLWKDVNERLRPLLQRDLRPGARVVSHDFKIPGWTPTKVVNMTTENGVSHTLYLYIRP